MKAKYILGLILFLQLLIMLFLVLLGESIILNWSESGPMAQKEDVVWTLSY